MEWIYFSPHLDDVTLSCGGLVWEQWRQGLQVSIWTICAGDPSPGPLSPFAELLHQRWQVGSDAVAPRRLEDIAACAEMGAAYRHLQVPDCIYRRGILSQGVLYPSETAIFGELHPEDHSLVEKLSAMLLESMPDQATLVCPLAIGGHVDHRLTRVVIEKVMRSKQNKVRYLRYYADYPYVRDEFLRSGDSMQPIAGSMQVYPVTADGLNAWQRAVTAYTSQISTFWPDLDTMRADLGAYANQSGGVRLWQHKQS